MTPREDYVRVPFGVFCIEYLLSVRFEGYKKTRPVYILPSENSVCTEMTFIFQNKCQYEKYAKSYACKLSRKTVRDTNNTDLDLDG